MAENKNAKKASAKKTSTTSSTKKTTKKNTTKKPAPKKVETVKEEKVVEEVKAIEEVKKPEVNEEKKASIVEVIKENATIIFLCLICLLLIINIILILKGNEVKLSNGQEVIASVDGKEITVDEIYAEIKKQYGTTSLINKIDAYITEKEIEDTASIEEDAKEQVASIKAQYEAMDYKWEDVLADYNYESEQVLVDEIKESLAKEQVAVNYLKSNLTEEEIQTYYNENIDDTFTAKHILIIPDTTDEMTDEEKANAEAAAKATAEEVINKLNNGEAWSTLVSTYSEDTGSKESDGLIENFTKGDVVDEFLAATKELADGTYTTTPVKSQYGYHIILRVSKTDKEALDTMKDELMDEIVNNKMTEDQNAYVQAWATVREKYNFKINDTEIDEYYQDAIKGE